jgi:hypothetical protein
MRGSDFCTLVCVMAIVFFMLFGCLPLPAQCKYPLSSFPFSSWQDAALSHWRMQNVAIQKVVLGYCSVRVRRQQGATTPMALPTQVLMLPEPSSLRQMRARWHWSFASSHRYACTRPPATAACSLRSATTRWRNAGRTVSPAALSVRLGRRPWKKTGHYMQWWQSQSRSVRVANY